MDQSERHIAAPAPTQSIESMRQRARMVRKNARSGDFSDQTAGTAPGIVQGNVAIMPSMYAHDFLNFCRRNPKPCPVIGMTDTGDPRLPELGLDIDIRTDVPKYKVFRDGILEEERQEITDLWTDDLVAFILGCSFSFEEALVAANVPVRHLDLDIECPMYKTTLATMPAGPFNGPMVVSMRPMLPKDAIRAIQITSRFPNVHGAPVHFGDPAAIGIDDIARVDYGGAVPVHDG